MSRDANELRVFQLAHDLALRVYQVTKRLPVEERFGLQAQIRRAATSVPTNIIEGCGRHSERDFARFLHIALASAEEARYLLRLSRETEMMFGEDVDAIYENYGDLIRQLAAFIRTIDDRLETEALKR